MIDERVLWWMLCEETLKQSWFLGKAKRKVNCWLLGPEGEEVMPFACKETMNIILQTAHMYCMCQTGI